MYKTRNFHFEICIQSKTGDAPGDTCIMFPTFLLNKLKSEHLRHLYYASSNIQETFTVMFIVIEYFKHLRYIQWNLVE